MGLDSPGKYGVKEVGSFSNMNLYVRMYRHKGPFVYYVHTERARLKWTHEEGVSSMWHP